MFKILGKTNIKINPIIMGCWQIGGAPYWNNIQDAVSEKAILIAFDAGINTFDTAPGYGNGRSERVLGGTLKNKRDKVIIATKVFSDKLAFGQVIKSCEDSLKNLQTDYIDLFQIHFPAGSFGSTLVPIEETLSAFLTLKNQGKVRFIGVSNFSRDQLEEASRYAEISSVQPPYSLFWRTQAESLVPYCEKNSISVLAYSPLAQGLLTGKFRRDHKFSDEEVRSKLVLCKPENYTHVQNALDKLDPIAKKNNMSLTELALAWVIAENSVCAISGIRTSAQAKINAQIINLSLSAADLDEIGMIGNEVSGYMRKISLMWDF